MAKGGKFFIPTLYFASLEKGDLWGQKRSAYMLYDLYKDQTSPFYDPKKARHFLTLSASLGYYRALFKLGIERVQTSKNAAEREDGIKILKMAKKETHYKRLRNIDKYVGLGTKQAFELATGEPL